MSWEVTIMSHRRRRRNDIFLILIILILFGGVGVLGISGDDDDC
jgi:hypothetical protein